ncbi:MAG TPA: site-specific DNA-methyltransferase [Candidatus Scalindua sp.]|nr:site-specific DNA-methyltransferase [Candidatus Scalindua sp.]
MKPYYEDKQVKIYCGDCLEIMPELLSGCIDMIMADPPYGTTACSWDSVIPLEPMWEQLRRLTKLDGAIVITASQPFTTTLISSNMKMFKYEWIWDKKNPTNFASANKQPMKYHENILVFCKGVTVYNPIKWNGKVNHKQGNSKTNFAETRGEMKRMAGDLSGLKFPKSIIEFEKHSSQCGLHPTQKPVALMEYLIKTYTNKGDMVLDFAMGSGTTLLAAKNLGQRAIGIELSEKYCDIAVKRLRQGVLT